MENKYHDIGIIDKVFEHHLKNNNQVTVLVRLVGWYYGIQFSNKTEQIIYLIYNYCKKYAEENKLDFNSIKWILTCDGDLYSPQSFTRFIFPLIIKFKQCIVLLFKKETNIYKLHAQYTKDDNGVTTTGYSFFYPDVNVINYEYPIPKNLLHKYNAVAVPKLLIDNDVDLGIRVLQWAYDIEKVHAVFVFCIGIEDIIKTEIKTVKKTSWTINKTVYIALMGLSRINKNYVEETCFDYPKSDIITLVHI